MNLKQIAMVYGIPGGLSNEKPADHTVSKIVGDLEDEIRSSNSEIKSFEPVSYRTQVVAGTNYFIKCRVLDNQDRESYVHLRVYMDLKGRLEFSGIKKSQEEKDPLMYFPMSQ